MSIRKMGMTVFSEKVVYRGDKRIKMAIESGIERRSTQLSPKVDMGQRLGQIVKGLIRKGFY